MNLNPLSLFRKSAPTDNSHRLWGLTADDDRFRSYARYMRAYRGYRYRTPTGQLYTSAQQANFLAQRVRFNFNKPVVNMGAAFLAGAPLQWTVDGSDDATQAAHEIWDRSGSERTLLKAARCCGIYGEIVGLAVRDEEGRPRIEFVCPDICTPTFRGSDTSQLVMLQIAWKEDDENGREVSWLETYTEVGREVRRDGEVQEDQSQRWERLPAVWIRNTSIQGLCFGISDLEDVADLVEEYDHIARKRGQAIDYYSQPNIVFEGVKKTESLTKDGRTVFFLNSEQGAQPAKAYFLEWSGTAPDVEQHLTRILDDIEVISQVPGVAFGRPTKGYSGLSGVALRIAFQPLLAKTADKQGNWGPDLEYLMHLCLEAEGKPVALEAVNVAWEDPLPVDTLALSQVEKLNVESGFHSTRTAMKRLGVEDVEQELKDIEAEQAEDPEEVQVGRFERFARAGAPLAAAAEVAGMDKERARRLGQRDVVDGLKQ